jgi:hypothetical protein
MKKLFFLLAFSIAFYSCQKCGVVHYEITKNIVPAKTGYPNTRDSVTAELCGTEYENARMYVKGTKGRTSDTSYLNANGTVYQIVTVKRVKSYGKE